MFIAYLVRGSEVSDEEDEEDVGVFQDRDIIITID
jgi:hypothetical protein